jgi:hypothetical protein
MSRLHEVFNDFSGVFDAKLRSHRTVSRTSTSRSEQITVTSRVALLEAKFDLAVLDRMHEPSFVGIERRVSSGSTPIYLIYEVTGVRPTHFQMLAMDTSLPTVIRKEYLDTIYQGWGKSEETWVDVACVPTGYKMTVNSNGEPSFSRTGLFPLVGAPAHFLSDYAVKRLLCTEKGDPLGTLLGFGLPLTVDLEGLVKYHAGVFGFTGSGKSNLTAQLIRNIISKAPDSTVVVFDVAGEYAIHLADILSQEGKLFTTETFADAESLVDSQSLPETLEGGVSGEKLVHWAQRLMDQGRVNKIVFERTQPVFTLNFLLDLLNVYVQEKKTGAVQAASVYQRVMDEVAGKMHAELDTPLQDLEDDAKSGLAQLLEEALSKLNDRSSLYGDLASFVDHLTRTLSEDSNIQDETRNGYATSKDLVKLSLEENSPKLVVVHAPEPVGARVFAADYITALLNAKKHGARRRVLVVLDEAQEYIPYNTRKDDFTEWSSRAVEALLRQGRKYRAHCWLATQRVAHLNTNALQQLHSYFVSTMPRYYDRMVVADAFSLNYEVLEHTTQLETGQWLFVSYKATKQKNVPVFIQAPDNEEHLRKWFNSGSNLAL